MSASICRKFPAMLISDAVNRTSLWQGVPTVLKTDGFSIPHVLTPYGKKKVVVILNENNANEIKDPKARTFLLSPKCDSLQSVVCDVATYFELYARRNYYL